MLAALLTAVQIRRFGRVASYCNCPPQRGARHRTGAGWLLLPGSV